MALRCWRGSWLDPFRSAPERRRDLEIVQQYEQVIFFFKKSTCVSRLSAAGTSRVYSSKRAGSEFIGFTGTKVQMLTQVEQDVRLVLALGEKGLLTRVGAVRDSAQGTRGALADVCWRMLTYAADVC